LRYAWGEVCFLFSGSLWSTSFFNTKQHHEK
jgi:hypothetical protein